MYSISSISLFGMNAAQTALSASAFNIANLGIDDLRRQQVEQTSAAPAGVSATLGPTPVPGDAMVTDMVDMLQAKKHSSQTWPFSRQAPRWPERF